MKMNPIDAAMWRAESLMPELGDPWLDGHRDGYNEALDPAIGSKLAYCEAYLQGHQARLKGDRHPKPQKRPVRPSRGSGKGLLP